MSKTKEEQPKRERSKKEWRDRRDFLKDLKAWWLQVYPEPKKQIKRYVTGLTKRIEEAEKAAA